MGDNQTDTYCRPLMMRDTKELVWRMNSHGGLRDLQFSRRVEAQRTEVFLSRDPQQFIVRDSPEAEKPWGQALLKSLGNVHGQRILQLGCSLGQFAVYLAQQGAHVTAADACPEALLVARRIAEINSVQICFQQASPDQVAVPPGTMDLVFALPTLHHLSRPDVQAAFRITHAALRRDGRAVLWKAWKAVRCLAFFRISSRPAVRQRKKTGLPSYFASSGDNGLSVRRSATCICPNSMTELVSSNECASIRLG